jgi:hypothetical protein
VIVAGDERERGSRAFARNVGFEQRRRKPLD